MAATHFVQHFEMCFSDMKGKVGLAQCLNVSKCVSATRFCDSERGRTYPVYHVNGDLGFIAKDVTKCVILIITRPRPLDPPVYILENCLNELGVIIRAHSLGRSGPGVLGAPGAAGGLTGVYRLTYVGG